MSSSRAKGGQAFHTGAVGPWVNRQMQTCSVWRSLGSPGFLKIHGGQNYSTGRQRQLDHHEVEASLFYKVSSRPAIYVIWAPPSQWSLCLFMLLPNMHSPATYLSSTLLGTQALI